MIEAIKTSHLFGKNFYLAINTIFKTKRGGKRTFDYIKPFYEEGLDACIIQDIGVFYFLRERFPDLEIHISTQNSITNKLGAYFLKKGSL